VGYRYLHLHGFGADHNSVKGCHLRDALAENGVALELPDLNVPCFEEQTYSHILRFIESLDESTPPGDKLRLTASSMGAYLAVRWNELHPDRVDRMFLLCPGFDLPARLPELVGEGRLARWEQEGALEVETVSLGTRMLHWEFAVDAHRHPGRPRAFCPARILHGRADETVPVQSSRDYVEANPHVDLVEVEDGHSLHDSLDVLVAEVRDFFELT
jgi:pimeloyl-ACP methyl ester carboxylesterase